MSDRSLISTYSVWQYEMKLPGTTLTLRGHSRGSEKTGFYIPQLKLMFDAGVTTYFEPQTILITHCHLDHCNALPMILASAAVQCAPSPVVCCPKEQLDLFEIFVHSAYQLNHATYSGFGKRFVGVAHGDRIPIEKTHFAKVFRLHHSVPSVGYGIYEERTKLAEKYKGLSSKELYELRAQGVELSEYAPAKILAFICDTTTDVFVHNPELLSFPIIIVECTFFEESLLALAEQSQHVHWLKLKPYVIGNPNITFILIHFSMRYEDLNVLIPDNEKPPNVIIWKN